MTRLKLNELGWPFDFFKTDEIDQISDSLDGNCKTKAFPDAARYARNFNLKSAI